MAGPTRGRLEGRITVPTGGWSGTIDDSGGGGAAAFSIPAGTYWLSSEGTQAISLIDQLAAQLNDAAPTDTITVTLSAGESGTGKVTITSSGSASIVLHASLAEVLGMSATLSSGTSWTGASQARSLWLPNCPYKAPNAVGNWRGWRESDMRTVENAAGYSFAHMGQEKEVNALSWNSVARSLVWEANATTDNASWERFARDCIWGVASWAKPGGPIRFYPDAADSAAYVTYKVVDFDNIQPEPLADGWVAGPWRIELPRLIVDPTDTGGVPRQTIAITNLSTTGSNTGGTSFTTASVSAAAGSLVLVAIASHGTGGGNAYPTAVTSTGMGLTFVQVDAGEALQFSGIGGLKNVTLWRAYTSFAVSGTVAITTNLTTTRIAWGIYQATGVSSAGSNGAGAIAQYKVGISATGGTTATATFTNSIEHPSNLNFCALGFSSTITAYTSGSGFTQESIGVPLSGAAIAVSAMHKTNSLIATASHASQYTAIIAVELVAGT